jgi:hypothetical protein
VEKKLALTHEVLWEAFRKGRLRGNWRTLTSTEKALYRASLAYTKPKKNRIWLNGQVVEREKRREIVNGLIEQKLQEFVGRLLETRGMRIFKRGFAKAVALLEKIEENDFCAWVPRLKEWLKDADYIFWLGTVRT